MSEHIFTLPDLGEGTVEAEVSEWHVNVGDTVQEDQPIADMMTDKAAVEVPSPVSGVVVSLGGEPGDIIAVGAPLVVFSTDGATAQPPVAQKDPKASNNTAATPPPAQTVSEAPVRKQAPVAEEPAPKPASMAATKAAPEPLHDAPTDPVAMFDTSDTVKVLTSPAIRRLAQEHHVDLNAVKGSGPRGRIMRADFERYVDEAKKPKASVTPSKRTGATEHKVIGMRRLIAKRMSASKSEIPHFSYVEEIDITALELFRRRLNQHYAEHGIKFSYLPLLVQVVSKALNDFPQCNALYDKERNVIVHHRAVHAGIATQTPDGLKVPVVHHVEAMTLPVLAQEIAATTKAAREGTAPKSKLSGSTITVTSLGKLGGIASTPVINQPEVSIIGVNRAVERPMIINGGIHIRLMMNLSASFDHRFVDGYDAASFIQAIKEMLENPAKTFAAG